MRPLTACDVIVSVAIMCDVILTYTSASDVTEICAVTSLIGNHMLIRHALIYSVDYKPRTKLKFKFRIYIYIYMYIYVYIIVHMYMCM